MFQAILNDHLLQGSPWLCTCGPDTVLQGRATPMSSSSRRLPHKNTNETLHCPIQPEPRWNPIRPDYEYITSSSKPFPSYPALPWKSGLMKSPWGIEVLCTSALTWPWALGVAGRWVSKMSQGSTGCTWWNYTEIWGVTWNTSLRQWKFRIGFRIK